MVSCLNRFFFNSNLNLTKSGEELNFQIEKKNYFLLCKSRLLNNLLETEIAAHSFAKKKIEEEFDKLLKRKRKSKLISMFYTPKYELIFPKGSNCNIFCRNVNYSVTNNQTKPSQHQ